MKNVEDKTTPKYYGGADNPYEVIKVINAWGLNFELANVCKYLARSGKKDKSKHIEDLEKAKKYLELEIEKQRNKPVDFKFPKAKWPFLPPSSFCIDEAGPIVCKDLSSEKEPVSAPGITMPFIDHQSTPEEVEKFMEAWSKGTKAGEQLRKQIAVKTLEEKSKKIQEWVDSKKDEGFTTEELIEFCENLVQ